ncbi:hypothetical protein ES703_62064 [subsurface metagenome]
MEIHKDIPFDVGIRTIEVRSIVAAAEKDTVIQLEYRSGALCTGKIDYVTITGCRTEYTAVKDDILIAAQTNAMQRLGVAD